MTQINSDIAQGVSFRDIAGRHGLSKSSVPRHAESCLGSSLAAFVEQNKAKQAIDVHAEFEANLAFAKRLRTAAEEYLADPADPLRLVIIPNADEIDVTYYDQFDLTEGKNPVPRKKTAKLSQLLAKAAEVKAILDENVEKYAEDPKQAVDDTLGSIQLIETEKVNIKHVDMRSFALNAISTVDACIDKFAKMAKLYSPDDDKPPAGVTNNIMVVMPPPSENADIEEWTKSPFLLNPAAKTNGKAV